MLSYASWTRTWIQLASAAALLVGIAACDRGGSRSNARGEPPPTNGGQGGRLHATGPLENVNIPLASAKLPDGCSSDILTFEKGKLVTRPYDSRTPRCRGAALVGTKLYAPLAGRTVELEITGIGPHESIVDPLKLNANQRSVINQVEEYQVTWTLDDGATAPRPVCPEGQRALAVPHAWSTSGELLTNYFDDPFGEDDVKYFTFACVPRREPDGRISGGGVIAKCIDWGYPPWSVNASTLFHPALRSHQVCTRMATADYCGEGKANTLDGTPIAFFDSTNVPTGPGGRLPSESLEGYHLEAVWGHDDCGRLKMLCLGKKRWSTLSIAATCVDMRSIPGLILQGSEEFEDTPPCEDWTKSMAIAQGAVFFSYSTFIDRVLVRFSSAESGEEFFMTTASITAPWRVDEYYPDLDGDGNPDAGRAPQTAVEGPILNPNVVEVLPDEIAQHLQQLYRCQSHGGQTITVNEEKANSLCDSTKARVLEGYIYGVNGGIKNNPLYLWTKGGRYATSTHRPAPGYDSPELLGYLPPINQLAERIQGLRDASEQTQ